MAECDSAAGCTNLGAQLAREGKNVEAFHAYARGCLFGSGQACFDLAHMMLGGEAVEADSGAAATVFAKGCSELRHGPSCHALAALYRKGHGNPDPQAEEPTRDGIPKNGPRAAIAYALGCEMGYSPSCTALGLMKVNADGVEQQAAEARTLFKRACDAGDATGCTCLGVCHATGLGGEPDLSAAKALFKQACVSGNDEACAFLRQAGTAADKGEDYIAADPVDGGRQ